MAGAPAGQQGGEPAPSGLEEAESSRSGGKPEMPRAWRGNTPGVAPALERKCIIGFEKHYGSQGAPHIQGGKHPYPPGPDCLWRRKDFREYQPAIKAPASTRMPPKGADNDRPIP